MQAGLDPLAADSDADGLSDSEDAAPLVPLDSDGDGVTDINDACAATVVASSYDTVDTVGCALSDLDQDSDGYDMWRLNAVKSMKTKSCRRCE